MKKTLLLSVVASTMIMAGGDIAPVEPVVEAPAPVASGWDFGGQAVAYYQTSDEVSRIAGESSGLFKQTGATANIGLQLRAVNKDLFSGIGAGFELSGLDTLELENDIVSGVMQMPSTGNMKAGWISQAYLTYAAGNTSFKFGRQELPKALSPFAFSEGWNVFKNTFDALLVVNSDIQDTTLVGAYVTASNTHGNMSNFDDISALGTTVEADAGVFMLTAQNKSIEGLTLTGTWYFAKDALAKTENVNILWADAAFAVSGLNIGLQGGTILGAEDLSATLKDTTAFGAKIGGSFDMFNASLAYSSVDDGTAPIENLGTNIKTPLYTQMILNQNFIKTDSDTIVARVGAKALGGKIGLAYNFSDYAGGEYTELDLTYKTKVGNTTLFAGYVYRDNDANVAAASFDENILRFWARYNF